MLEDLIYEWKDIGFALIVAGVCPAIFLYAALSMRREARAARHWRKTTGTVVTSRVEARLQKPNDAGLAGLPLVEYEFKIDDRSYRGWGIYAGSTSSAHGLTNVREQYPVGAQVIVRYNPADPRQAIMECELPQGEILAGCLLLLAIGMPLAWLLLNYDFLQENVVLVIVCSVVPVALMVVMIAKVWEIRAARHWLQTTGTVVTSCVESRKKTPGDNDSDSAVVNSPNVVYEYKVDDWSFRCGRITIGERTSEYELESILDRYPVGAQVIVYYNPADPQQAVLERDVPASTFWIGGGCVLTSIVVPLVAILIYKFALDWFDGGAIILSAMGLATLGLAIAYTAMSAQASAWPIARGRIVAADVDAFLARPHRRRTYFKPSVLYVYEVNGRQYLGDRIRIATVISSTIPGLARRTAAMYPVGMEVDVHYNPKKPSESVLHPWSLWVAFPWLIVMGFLFGLWWSLAGAN